MGGTVPSGGGSVRPPPHTYAWWYAVCHQEGPLKGSAQEQPVLAVPWRAVTSARGAVPLGETQPVLTVPPRHSGEEQPVLAFPSGAGGPAGGAVLLGEEQPALAVHL